jgi:multicomponent Na+:H+ antiporter subunit B
MTSPILTAASRILVSLILLFSVYMLLRGHNEPGGGFIGGLIAAIGITLYTIAFGAGAAREVLRIDPTTLAVTGLAISFCAGIFGAAFAAPPFVGEWWFVGASGDDKGLALSNVLIFDVGVYLGVIGAVLTLVIALEEEG